MPTWAPLITTSPLDQEQAAGCDVLIKGPALAHDFVMIVPETCHTFPLLSRHSQSPCGRRGSLGWVSRESGAPAKKFR